MRDQIRLSDIPGKVKDAPASDAMQVPKIKKPSTPVKAGGAACSKMSEKDFMDGSNRLLP